MNKESPTIDLDQNIDDELRNVVEGERNTVKREKFDLSSTRIVLDKLLEEGLIEPGDNLARIREVVEKEFKKIEGV